MFHTKVVEKIKTHILCWVSFENGAVYEIMCGGKKKKLSQEGHRWQYGACALHTGYLRLQTHWFAFPGQQFLRERPSKLLYMYNACLWCGFADHGELQQVGTANTLTPVLAQQEEYSSEISPRCNNCVFILRNGFTLHVSGDNLTHHQEYIYCIWPQVSRLT